MKALCAVVVGLAALALTACSSSSTSADKSTSPSSAASTPSPSSAEATQSSAAPSSPTTWSLQTAQQKYLAYVAPGNKLVDQVRKLGTYPRLSSLKRLCGQLADSDDTFARQLSAGAWPATVRAEVRPLISSVVRERTAWQRCVTAENADDAYSAVNKTGDADQGEAEQMRIALGLPGTPNSS